MMNSNLKKLLGLFFLFFIGYSLQANDYETEKKSLERQLQKVEHNKKAKIYYRLGLLSLQHRRMEDATYHFSQTTESNHFYGPEVDHFLLLYSIGQDCLKHAENNQKALKLAQLYFRRANVFYDKNNSKHQKYNTSRPLENIKKQLNNL